MIRSTQCVVIFAYVQPKIKRLENLSMHVTYRPCAMVVPDYELIAEIMLVAEGFINARILARKFLTLYTLCKELLSKQDHYDWGLRAIKSVLVVAGSLKRGDRGRPEDQVKGSIINSLYINIIESTPLVCVKIFLREIAPAFSD